eukprot:jgi/Mesvir1/26754/Mv20530-RA.1
MDKTPKKYVIAGAVACGVVLLALAVYYLKKSQQKAAIVLPSDQIDPEFEGFYITPVSRMTREEFRQKTLDFDNVGWKDAKTNSNDPPYLRIIVADGKIDVIEIVATPAMSNGVPMAPKSMSQILPMDVRTAKKLVEARNGEDWDVVSGERLALIPADETVTYVVLKKKEETRPASYRLAFFRAAVTSPEFD